MISCAVTAQLICAFVFIYAKIWSSLDGAYMVGYSYEQTYCTILQEKIKILLLILDIKSSFTTNDCQSEITLCKKQLIYSFVN